MRHFGDMGGRNEDDTDQEEHTDSDDSLGFKVIDEPEPSWHVEWMERYVEPETKTISPGLDLQALGLPFIAMSPRRLTGTQTETPTKSKDLGKPRRTAKKSLEHEADTVPLRTSSPSSELHVPASFDRDQTYHGAGVSKNTNTASGMSVQISIDNSRLDRSSYPLLRYRDKRRRSESPPLLQNIQRKKRRPWKDGSMKVQYYCQYEGNLQPEWVLANEIKESNPEEVNAFNAQLRRKSAA